MLKDFPAEYNQNQIDKLTSKSSAPNLVNIFSRLSVKLVVLAARSYGKHIPIPILAGALSYWGSSSLLCTGRPRRSREGRRQEV